jgi:hypothetical protein
MLVDASSDCETVRFLLETASTVFELISEDMEGFALKREATRRHLASEDEEDAYFRPSPAAGNLKMFAGTFSASFALPSA